MDATSLRRAQEGAEVLWILERVDHQNEGWLVLLAGEVQNFKHTAVRILADLQGDSLVIGAELVELEPRDERSWNLGQRGQLHDLIDPARWLHAICHLQAQQLA